MNGNNLDLLRRSAVLTFSWWGEAVALFDLLLLLEAGATAY